MRTQEYQRLASRIGEVLSAQLFFIGGAQKSGTTWLQRLLDAHPEIFCAGEGHFADRFMVNLQKTLADYADLLDKAAERVYEGKPFYRRPGRKALDFMVMSLAGLMWDRAGIPQGVKCIGDKTPRNAAYFPALKRVFPGARFIHIVRDGRDVLVSRVLHVQRVASRTPGLDPADYTFAQRTNEYARDWARQVERAVAFAEQFPDACLLVRYEDLSARTEEELARIFRFLGVSDSPEVAARCREAASFERLTGGRRPGQEDRDSFLRKGVAGDWKEHLDENTLAAFNAAGGALMQKLGYA